jgi:hypothetical protein
MARLFSPYRGDFLLEQRKAWEQALDAYEKAVQASHLVEPFYHGIMRCHDALGRRAEALSAFDRCRRTLAAAGTAMSADTAMHGRAYLPTSRGGLQ